MPDGTNDAKDRILDVAAELFMERGFAATSVREIGDAAGVGQSSLYHHVKSKGQILADLHESFIGRLLERLREVDEGDADPRQQIREVVRVVLSVVETHQARVTVFLREGHALSEDSRASIREERDSVDAIVDGIIQRGIKSGEFRSDLDVRLTRLAVLGMCNWSYQWFRPGGPYGADEIAEHFADIVLRGIESR